MNNLTFKVEITHDCEESKLGEKSCDFEVHAKDEDSAIDKAIQNWKEEWPCNCADWAFGAYVSDKEPYFCGSCLLQHSLGDDLHLLHDVYRFDYGRV